MGFLDVAHGEGDLSIEDLKERYYVSYEMAAHRFTNLATRHLDLPVHFLRTDTAGTITKAYENDGLAFPSDEEGGLEGVQGVVDGLGCDQLSSIEQTLKIKIHVLEKI